MERQRKLFIAKTAVMLGVIPVLIWAHEYGPDAGNCNVPKELGTCAQAGCHVGTANSSANKGSIAVNFPGGTTYTPGVRQHLTVTISDPATTQRAWGFQLTARNASASGTQAGTFASTDALTTLMCASSNLFQELEVDFGTTKAQTCPSTLTLQYIEHSLAGYNDSRGKTGSYTFQFDWTPPATNVGDITIYVAANAANGDLTVNGDHIYSTTVTVTPAAAGGTPPAISGAVSASGYGGFSVIAPGTYVEIKGTNLATDTLPWDNAFSGVNAPTTLAGAKVTIGGQSAFISYASPGQVNVLVPSTVATGSQQITVTTASGTSNAFPVTVNALEPGLLALPQAPWLSGSKQYVVAQSCDAGKKCLVVTDLNFILPTGTSIPGYPVRPAKPGEILTIYGIGFGPAIDSSNLTVPVGQIVGVANQLVNQVQMQVNGVPATLLYAGLGPGLTGAYQFNLMVPTVPDGDWPLTFTQNGTKGAQTLLLSVHQ